VDNDGDALTYNGTSWSAPTSIDGNNTLDSVSCTGSSFCAAVDAKGNVVTYNGTSWSDTASVDSTRRITSISCPTATFCAAVDSKGYVTIYGLVPASAPSQFIWDTNGSLPLVLSDGINDYIYGPGTTPVEEVSLSSSTASFMTYTPSDSSWLVTNAAGDEVAFYGYDAFGNLAFGTPASPFGYAGQYTDPSTGFSNLRARWYAPQTGSFTTRDPAFASTDAAFTYAGDDPVNENDPSGKAWCDFLPWGCSHLPGGNKGAASAHGFSEFALDGYGVALCADYLGECGYVWNPVIRYYKSLACHQVTSEQAVGHLVQMLTGLYAKSRDPIYAEECQEGAQSCLSNILIPGIEGIDGAATPLALFQQSRDDSLVWWSLKVTNVDAHGLAEFAEALDDFDNLNP
jgi:RHS repeat-associated protein